ncbi:hypothetical protein [Bradyrhizobium sp.]|uniref:hypothetical protein n=1 Tax=Bradyrhizobium sp. TaxID=376 RepID=UPI003C6EF551
MKRALIRLGRGNFGHADRSEAQKRAFAPIWRNQPPTGSPARRYGALRIGDLKAGNCPRAGSRTAHRRSSLTNLTIGKTDQPTACGKSRFNQPLVPGIVERAGTQALRIPAWSGVSVVADVIERNDGKLIYSSKIDKGSHFAPR